MSERQVGGIVSKVFGVRGRIVALAVLPVFGFGAVGLINGSMQGTVSARLEGAQGYV